MQSMSLGHLFFRDTKNQRNGKKEFVLIGKLWVPADSEAKSEHLYLLVGSELAIEGKSTMSLQMMFESASDMSEVTKKKDPNRIIPLIQSPY